MSDAPQAELKITPPADILVRHWSCFTKAQQAYVKAHEDASTAEANYMGSLACIKAGYFHIEGPQNLLKYLDTEFDNVPMAFVGAINRGVANVVLTSIVAPLG
jgi:hypothetical protein